MKLQIFLDRDGSQTERSVGTWQVKNAPHSSPYGLGSGQLCTCPLVGTILIDLRRQSIWDLENPTAEIEHQTFAPIVGELFLLLGRDVNRSRWVHDTSDRSGIWRPGGLVGSKHQAGRTPPHEIEARGICAELQTTGLWLRKLEGCCNRIGGGEITQLAESSLRCIFSGAFYQGKFGGEFAKIML